MVEPIPDMPAGTLGFRARGALTGADYRETLIPALRRAVAAGPVRLLLVVADDVERLDLGRRLSQARGDLSFGARALERTALVTDVGWIRTATRLFGRLVPGELRLFAVCEEHEARGWIVTDH
jgi:hypothetical protein